MRNVPITQEDHIEVINVGLKGFYESIKMQGVPCVHAEWAPPAGGNKKLIEILDRLKELEEGN